MIQNNFQIEQLLADDSFVRWVEGKASEKEKAVWEAWAQNDPVRKDMVKKAITIHNSFSFTHSGVSNSEVDEELQKLHSSIDNFELPDNKRKPFIKSLYPGKRGYYSAVAAGIVLLITVLAVAQLFFQNTVVEEDPGPAVVMTEAGFGEKKVLTLSDGSTITLNSNSSLKYPSNETGNRVDFWLTGEAYFDISTENINERNYDKYRVHTEDGIVEVVGTKFNVNTFQAGTEVVLEKGKVRVEIAGSQNESGSEYIMNPGEWSSFSYNGESINIREVDVELFTSWTQNKLIFAETPLTDIAKRIEHIYGVQFLIPENDLQQIKISGSVPNDNLPVLINALESILGRTIIHTDGIIRIDQESDNP